MVCTKFILKKSCLNFQSENLSLFLSPIFVAKVPLNSWLTFFFNSKVWDREIVLTALKDYYDQNMDLLLQDIEGNFTDVRPVTEFHLIYAFEKQGQLKLSLMLQFINLCICAYCTGNLVWWRFVLETLWWSCFMHKQVSIPLLFLSLVLS